MKIQKFIIEDYLLDELIFGKINASFDSSMFILLI